MKKALIFTAVLAAAVSLQAQGLITVANNSATAVTNAVTGGRATSTTPIWIGLFYTTDVGAVADPIGGQDLFQLSTPAVSIGNFPGIFSAGVRTLGDTGQEVLIQIRVWDKAFAGDNTGYRDSLNSAAQRFVGFSEVMRGNLGGGSLPTPSITGAPFSFRSFTVDVVPEPSVLALGFLGAVGTLVLFRRRK